MSVRYAALIRHGAYHQREDTPSALQPHPLTREGRAQARACGVELVEILRQNEWALDPLAWSSRQLRAWETGKEALGVLAEAGFPCRIEQTGRLSERSLGSAANLATREIETVLAADPRFGPPPPGWKSDSDYRLPLQGAESLAMAGRRVADLLVQTMQNRPETEGPQLTLFFGHGASFRHAACNLGLLAQPEIAQLSMYHAKPLLVCYNPDGTWEHFSGTWKRRSGKNSVTD